MLRLNIRNKWISLRGGSYVTDANEKNYLYVKGKFWTVTHKKFVQDMQGNTLYTVRNKFWTFITQYAMIYDDKGEEVARFRKKVFSLHDHYDIKTKYGMMVLRGNILGFDYHVFLNDQEIGHVGRHISLRDSFFLDIDDTKISPAFMVAMVIALDNLTDERAEQSY